MNAWLDRTYFEKLSRQLFDGLKPKEHLSLNLYSESSQFVRLNAAKIRQIGTVQDALLEMTMIFEAPDGFQKSVRSLTLCGLSYEDEARAREALQALRSEVKELPIDPFAELPRNDGESRSEVKGELLPIDTAVAKILEPLGSAKGPLGSVKGPLGPSVDIAGIYASGPIVRAMANSSGQTHWFLTEGFSLDYSLYTSSQRALKGTFTGTSWDDAGFRNEIDAAKARLTILEREPRRVPRGAHRTYLAPAAVANLISMFSWGALSEASIRQGDSCLRLMRSGERKLSPLFDLSEDFRGGETPRFNSEGELAPELLPLIEKGEFVNALVSSRSSKEYQTPSNQANASETLRAPSVAAGTLSEDAILKRLGTGLYLSNLHYLNWSDEAGGRITGMTRYACFWVENGAIVAPIENMRWDDSLFSLFGTALEELTRSRTYLPSVTSYFMRELGGIWAPGMLVSAMNFTL